MKTVPFIIAACLALFSFSCKKSSDKDTSQSFYYRATINGQQVDLTAKLTSTADHAVASTTKGARDFMGTYWVADYYRGSEITKLSGMQPVPPMGSVFVLRRINDYDPTPIEENAMFYVGNYVYGRSGITYGGTTVNGAVVEYIDNNLQFWTSEIGSQAGSTFTITSIGNNSSPQVSEKVFTATFNCKLYNRDTPSLPPLTVTNGSMRGAIF